MSHRSLEEQQTAVADPAWPMMREWIADGRQVVAGLSADRVQAEATATRLALQVTTRSPMGALALALETGGILVDHGWLRRLGSGHARLPDTRLTWNGLGEPARGARGSPLEGGFVVAVDVLGGVFALNGGGRGPEPGMHYFAPDRPRWEALECSHLAWIEGALTGDLAQFYSTRACGGRWPGWEREVAALAPAYGISIYPFAWTAGPPGATRARRAGPRAGPLAERWPLEREIAQQLQDVSPGTERRSRCVSPTIPWVHRASGLLRSAGDPEVRVGGERHAEAVRGQPHGDGARRIAAPDCSAGLQRRIAAPDCSAGLQPGPLPCAS